MTAKKLFLFVLLLVCQMIWAQQDSIVPIEEVVVSDSQLRNFSNSQSIQKLNDSIIERNQPSLTSLLNYNSVIYFKENGLGMVSSPSFRGTTAQQTAVVWNGININSQFTGQTDFNTISTVDYNSVTVRAGGGSVIYGTGAIGGSIHLGTDLDFSSHFDNQLHLQYGSFNTLAANYRVAVSNGRFSFQGGISRNSSDNDYKFPGRDRRNSNGQFENTGFSANFGYRLNAANYLKFYSQVFDGERHFSLLTPTDTKTKYRDFNTRNMLEWAGFYNRFTSRLKLAYLSEEYQYFETISSDLHSGAKSESVLAKYDAAYQFGSKIALNALVDYTQTTGRGSDVDKSRREIGSFALLLRHQVLERLQYEIGARKELTNNYESPLLFSAGANYKLTDFYRIKINGSRNFRIPTFNDLYWGDGGNPNLKPESSYQAEFGNEFSFRKMKLTVTGYYIKITDMIQWLPGTTASWFPQNVNKVNTYGVEAIGDWHHEIGRHRFVVTGTYAYTVSKNENTGYQLIYVPYHKATGSLAYGIGKFTANYQMLFNGAVFTRSDNNSRYNIDPYTVSNIGIEYGFGKTGSCKLGFQLRNAFNENYEVMVRRPFPGRNYTFYLTFNF